MPFNIVRGDITKIGADAIVNAANTSLLQGGGVCGAIFRAAGADRLRDACGRLAPIGTGEAVITEGFNLPARYIIHTAGPVFRGGDQGEEAALRACYRNSLKLAVKHGCESIVFPLISSGIYGYPKAAALEVAVCAIKDFLLDSDMDVTLVLFDKEAFVVGGAVLSGVESYIDEHYAGEPELGYSQNEFFRSEPEQEPELEFAAFAEIRSLDVAAPASVCEEFDDLVGNLDEPFSETLLRLIDAKGKTDVEVYKRANIDRKLFSKIRAGKGYMPSKKTAVALAVALELSLGETGDLLGRAGYALSHAVKFDVIVEYFITNGKYDIFEINKVLFNYDQPLLGG